MSASVTLRELVRADVAKELSMTGRVLGASEAYDLGLLTRVCDDPVQVRSDGYELRNGAWATFAMSPQEAERFARDISVRSPDSVAATKVLFNQTSRTSNERDALALETELQKRLLPSWNQLAAVSATLRKAPPRYIRRKRVWDKYLKD